MKKFVNWFGLERLVNMNKELLYWIEYIECADYENPNENLLRCIERRVRKLYKQAIKDKNKRYGLATV